MLKITAAVKNKQYDPVVNELLKIKYIYTIQI